MRMILSKMVPFYDTIAFACGWTKAIQKRNVWTRIFLETDDNITIEERTYRSLSQVLNKLTFASCCQLPMSKSLFLRAFNLNRSLTNQSSMFPIALIALRATPLSLPDTLGLSATYTYECHLHSNACWEGGSIGSRMACAGVSCKQKGTKTVPLWDHYLER